MMYSIHTFEMVKTFNTWNEYQRLFAFIKFDAKENGYNILYNEGPVNVPVSKFAGNGIRVLLHQDGYNSFVRFIINLHAVLHEYDPLEIISPDEADEALDKANDMLVDWLGEDFSIDRLVLTRIDCCVNVDVGSPEYVTAYIKQFYKTNAAKGFKTVNLKKQGYKKDAGYIAECSHYNEEISVYDKQKQVESTLYNAPYLRAKGILRIEFRKRWRVPRQVTRLCTNRNRQIIQYHISNSRDIIREKLELFIIDADYYKTDKAQRLIMKNVRTDKRCQRMIKFVALVSKRGGILKAREVHKSKDSHVNGAYYKKMCDEFTRINVNPVPLPSSSELKMLPSLFRFLE